MKLSTRISSIRRSAEAVQVVLGGLRLDVAGLVGQMGAAGVDRSPSPSSTRVTGSWASQSICRSGYRLAQLAGYRDVSLRVAEADRR